MCQHELFILRRACRVLAVLRGLQSAVDSAIAIALRSLMPNTSP